MAACPKAAWPGLKAMLHSVYDQPDAAAVSAQFDKLLDTVADTLPAVHDHLDTARADILAFTGFPKEIWRQIWSNNPNERLNREILGVTSSEDGAGWLAFFRDLTARGLSGVKLVTSDAHAGLVSAIGATLPGAAWQRCRTHYAANLMSATPKSSWGWVKALLHSIYDQPDAEAVHAQFDRVVDALAEKLPTVAEHLEEARADIVAFTVFPKEIWRQIWSNNPIVILSLRPWQDPDLRVCVVDAVLDGRSGDRRGASHQGPIVTEARCSSTGST